ncbi:MAG: tetratricopeptide repeat protein [Pseudomonadota bacterium]
MRLRRLATTLLLGLATAGTAWGQDAFEAGREAFEAGDFEAAAEAFERARDAGESSATIHYNLGVSYYWLGRYNAATEAFRRAAETPAMRALAWYNLGLVARARGDSAAAREWFRRSHEAAEEPALRERAARELAQEGEPERPWSAVVSLKGGHDDNVVSPDTDTVSDNADAYLEAYAAGSVTLTGTEADGWSARAAWYALDYFDLDDYDLNLLRGQLQRQWEGATWATTAGVELDHSTLGGDAFLDTLSARLEAERPLGETWLALRYRPSVIRAGQAGYDYLAGQRHQLRARARWFLDESRLDLTYHYETNDRDDYEVGTEFASYSPRRHGLAVSQQWNLAPRWWLDWEVEGVRSDYPDTDVLADGAQIRREETRLTAGVSLTRRLSDHWRLTAEARRTDTDSTLRAYDYAHNEIAAGVTGSF